MIDLNGKRVFLSGPMTGHEHYNCEAFARAHARLKEAGAYEIYDPALSWLQGVTEGDEATHEQWVRKCLHILTKPKHRGWDAPCEPYFDFLVQLDGWETSNGAIDEYEVARACGIVTIELEEVFA